MRKQDSFLFFRVIGILVFLKIMYCYYLKMLTEWQVGVLKNKGKKIFKQ